MTAITKKSENPTAHLTEADIEALGAELDSRAVRLVSAFPPAWVAGTIGLSIAKILENMEIGHNVMHGQWDWMRDPKIHSQAYEWDHASPSTQWKRSHNEIHHTFTNVLGR